MSHENMNMPPDPFSGEGMPSMLPPLPPGFEPRVPLSNEVRHAKYREEQSARQAFRSAPNVEEIPLTQNDLFLLAPNTAALAKMGMTLDEYTKLPLGQQQRIALETNYPDGYDLVEANQPNADFVLYARQNPGTNQDAQ